MADDVVTPEGEPFHSTGQTRLAVPTGRVFHPNTDDGPLPVITPEGVNVSKADAEAILAQSDAADGRVFKVENEEGQ